MDINDFLIQLEKLREKELKQKIWEFWLARYPTMNENNYQTYEEMLAQAKQQETKENIQTNGIYVDQAFF